MSPTLDKSDSKELGRQTALTLMREMRFLQPPKDVPTNHDLIDGPDKVVLRFQEVDKQDALHTQYEMDYTTFGLRYCMADGEVSKKGQFDIDHAYAHSKIKKKQIALLEYLNSPDNADFAAGFLSVKENDEDINKYFGVEEIKDEAGKITGKTIKGRRYFYRVCYDDINNLLLLCHACNMHKSDKDYLEWFGTQEPLLGKAFIEAVKAAGDLHDGVIVQKVMKVAEDASSIEIAGVKCILHQGEGKGLGQFLKNWFDEKYRGHQKSIVQNYSDIWLAFKDVVEQERKNGGTKVGSKLAAMLTTVLKTVHEHYYDAVDNTATTGNKSSSHMDDSVEQGASGSSSNTDESSEKGYRIEVIYEKVKFMLTKMHQVKKVGNYVMKQYKGLLEDGIDKPFIHEQFETYKLADLGDQQQLLALSEMNDELEKKKKELNVHDKKKGVLSKEDLKSIIKTKIELHDYSHAIQRAETAEQRAVTAEQKAEEERKKAEEERKKAEEERKRAEEERKRAEEERKRAEEERKRAEEAEQKAEAERRIRQEVEEELKQLKALSGTSQIAERSHSQENQEMFVSEEQTTQAKPPVVEEEESEIVKPTAKRSIAQKSGFFSSQLAAVSPKSEGDINLTDSTNPLSKKRPGDHTDEEMEDPTIFAKKRKLAEETNQHIDHQLGSIQKASDPVVDPTQEQSSAPNPPPSPGSR